MKHLSPYLILNREDWHLLRQDTPMPLVKSDLDKLHGQIEIVSLKEIIEIYLPLSRLLNYYISAAQSLHQVTGRFLSKPEPKVPYIIGVAGSVAVGKSTTSRILQALLSRWSNHPTVSLIPTDGFIMSNAELESRGLSNRKGFPESYYLDQLLAFLMAIKSGKTPVRAPMYSHHKYDVIPGQYQEVVDADIVILEGLNILQIGAWRLRAPPPLFVSDFLDFTIFVDAEEPVIQQWYVERFCSFQKKAFQDPKAYFYRFSQLNVEQTINMALRFWNEVNRVNLEENILPFKYRAHLLLHKTVDHSVDQVWLRKL